MLNIRTHLNVGKAIAVRPDSVHSESARFHLLPLGISYVLLPPRLPCTFV